MRPGLAGRLSRALVGCHPRRWRERYGDEMLDVLGQHDPTARTVASMGASAVSAHLDPAWQAGRPLLPRLRRAALISALTAAPLMVFAVPFAYGAWQDDHWRPASDENLLAVGFAAHSPVMVTAFGGALDGTDMMWDTMDPGRPRRLSQFEGGQPTALSPDGRTVATVAFHQDPALWNVADPQHPAELTTLPNGDGGLRGQVFSPDGRVLAAAYDHQVLLWNVARPARPRLLSTLNAPVTSDGDIPYSPQDVAFSPAGNLLASATGAGQVTVWSVADPGRAFRLATLGGADGATQGLAFSPGGNLLAVLTEPGTMLVYSLADPAHPVRTATVRGLLTRARYSDGQAKPDEVLCGGCGLASWAVAFAPSGHTLTVVVNRTEMSANSGRDTIIDWHVTGSGILGDNTASIRDVADSQPIIVPGDRTVMGGPGNIHTWKAWPLPRPALPRPALP
jgi:WD40 repeat protein